MPIDFDSLPQDAKTLQKMVLDLAEQMEHAFTEQHIYQSLLLERLERRQPQERAGPTTG